MDIFYCILIIFYLLFRSYNQGDYSLNNLRITCDNKNIFKRLFYIILLFKMLVIKIFNEIDCLKKI